MKIPSFIARRRISAKRSPRKSVSSTPQVEALESRIAPATLVTLSGGNLSVQGDQTANHDEALIFTISGTNLHIADAAHAVTSAGGGVTQSGANSVDIPLGSITGSLSILTGTGTDSVQLSANLSGLTSITVDTGSLLQDHDISLTGTASASFTTKTGLTISGGAHLTTQTGNITLSANQQVTPSTGNFAGIEINGATVEATGTGAVSLTGRGGSIGDHTVGVLVTNGATVSGGTGAALTITGFGGTSIDGSADGILIGDSGTKITSHGANVQLTGTGGGSGASSENLGVNITGSGLVTAGGTGNVSITGTGSSASTGGSNYGVGVRSGAHVTTGGGNVFIIGTGGNSSGGHNIGVLLSEVSVIDAASSGTVSVTGTGGAGVSDGVALASGVTGNAKITSAGGAVTVTGTAGPGAGSAAIDLLALDTISAGTGGSLTLIGNSMTILGTVGSAGTASATFQPLTAGTAISLGIETVGALSLTDAELDHVTAGSVQIGTATSGAITVSAAISHGNSLSLVTGSGVTINDTLATSGSALSITTDTLAINAAVSAPAAGSVTFKPLTAGRAISLGAENGSALSLTDAELDLVSGGTITLGDAAAGSITVAGAITHPAGSNFALKTNGDIVFNSGFATGGGTLALQPGATGSVQPLATGTDVTTAAGSAVSFAAGSKLAIAVNGPTANSQYSQLNVAGQVNLSGSTLQLGGSYVPSAGQSFTLVANDGTDPVVGTFAGLAEGATVVLNGVNLRISYVGGDGNDVTLSSNSTPTVTRAQGAVVVNEGQTLTNSGSFTDADAGQTVSITSSVGTITQTNGNNGTYTWSLPTSDDFGAQTVTITATDSLGASSTTSFTIQANNIAPTPSITGPASGLEGSAISLTGSATDPAGANDPITFTWSVTKNGNAYATGSGANINFTPDDDGTYVTTLTANDGDGGISSATHTVAVGNVAPTLTVSGPSTSNEGSPYTLNLAKSDPGTDTISSWTINWGDGSAAQIVSGSATSVTHTFADNGSYSISSTATDEDGTYASNTLGVAVANVAPTPSITGPASSLEGSAISLTGSATDPAGANDPITFTWSVTKNGNAYATGSGANINFTPDDDGTYVTTLTANDGDGGISSATHTVAVGNVAPTLTVSGASTSNEGSPYTLNLAKSDPGTDTISSWTINWGDGSAPQIVSGSATSVTHTFADNGNYSISSTATDEDGTYASNTLGVAVANVAPTLTISGANGSNEGSAYTLNLAKSDPGAGTISSWTINWGDGSAPQIVSGSTTSVNHTFADDGSYSISASATDEDGSYAANTKTVAVANVAPTPSISGPANGLEGSAISLTGSATDPAGANDPITFTWSVTKNGNAFATGSSANINFTPDDDGTYVATLTANDGDGGITSVSKTVAVGNVAPTLTVSGASTSNEGSPYTLNLAKSDPGADTISSWTINWGDGSAPQIVSSSATTVTHTFADNGNYSISSTATDEDGTYSSNTLGVAVANVAPTLTISGANGSNEGSAYSLNLAKSDPGTDTISSWTINWGDGSAPQIVSGSATTVNHTFADNGNYSISASATDEDGSYSANTKTVAVANVAPNLTISGASSTTQGSTYSLGLNSADPGADTISSWTINWGDGSAAQVVSGNSSSVTHVYSAAGNFTISSAATDEDGSYTGNTQSVAVATVAAPAPTVSLGALSPIDEGSIAKLTGSFTDSSTSSTHQLTINWADPNYSPTSTFTLPATASLNAGTTFAGTDGTVLTVTAVNKTTGAVSYSANHLYKDDGPAGGNGTASDVSNIAVTVKNNSSSTTGSSNTALTVKNVAPVLGDCDFISAGSTNPADRGDYVVLTSSFTDTGVLDGERVIIDWGDGTTTDSSTGITSSGTIVATYNGLGGFLASHKYTSGGIFDVTYRVVDDDGGSSASQTTQAFVAGVRLVAATGELQIVGKSGDDSVLVNYKGADGQGDTASANADDKTKVVVHASLENDCGNVEQINASFTATQVKSVFIATGSGSDYVHVSNNLVVPTYISTGGGNDTVLGSGGADVIDGGDGDDTLSGADGNDIILGGSGNDKLYAGNGMNVLSGGDGNDLLQGGSTRDVLIGGRGSDDLRGGSSATDTSIGDILIGGLTKNETNVEALRSILTIWSSNDTYANIVNNLTKVGGLLEVGVQVFDDHAVDTLTGGAKAKDLFFADLDHLHGDDDIVNGSANDTIKNLAEILVSGSC